MVVCTTVVQVQQHDIGDKSPFDVRIVSIVVEAIAAVMAFGEASKIEQT